MSDPNQPPVTPPPANPPAMPPAYQSPQSAPPYGQNAPAQPAYGQPAYGQPAATERYNVLAIVSFVSAFFIQLAAVICGHIALSQIKKTGEKGRGLAIAGLVIGYLGILAGIIILGVLIPTFISIMNDPNLVNRYDYPG